MDGEKKASRGKSKSGRDQTIFPSDVVAVIRYVNYNSTHAVDHLDISMKGADLMNLKSKRGMEMVQVAILIAIAVTLGLIFRERIMDFIDGTFDSLESSGF